MQHCDEDTLALAALGEPLPAEPTEHLRGCATCRSDVAQLREVVTAARSPHHGQPAVPVAPPTSVWAGIAAATGVTVTLADAQASDDSVSHTGAGTQDDVLPPVRLLPAAEATARPRRRRSMLQRQQSLLVAVAAGLVGVLLGTGATLYATRNPNGAVVASTQLAPLPVDPGARGVASVVSTSSGRTLVVNVSRLGATPGFYEVWLIDPTVTKMVPVGILHDGTGHFAIPDDLNLQAYPIVDISAEPMDGNPKHSGDSLVRGSIRV